VTVSGARARAPPQRDQRSYSHREKDIADAEDEHTDRQSHHDSMVCVRAERMVVPRKREQATHPLIHPFAKLIAEPVPKIYRSASGFAVWYHTVREMPLVVNIHIHHLTQKQGSFSSDMYQRHTVHHDSVNKMVSPYNPVNANPMEIEYYGHITPSTQPSENWQQLQELKADMSLMTVERESLVTANTSLQSDAKQVIASAILIQRVEDDANRNGRHLFNPC
jgi:hypothetical protein